MCLALISDRVYAFVVLYLHIPGFTNILMRIEKSMGTSPWKEKGMAKLSVSETVDRFSCFLVVRHL